MSQQNFYIRNAERGMISHVNDVHGYVTSYDEKKHLAKVTYQPSGEESGWLPIEESHIGNGWGILAGLTPGSGQGSGQGGAGSGGGGGGSGGGGGGGGGGGQSQYQGDQVIVRFQGGQLNSGKITKRVHSQVDKPPKVKSGEILHMHALGARWHFKDDGSTHFYDKTSSQDDQNGQQSQGGQGAQGGGAGAGGGGGGPTPLKNPPPSEPQSCHFMCDGKGKSVLTHFQQDQRKSGQDEQDPNQKKSPAAYHRRSVSGKDMTHDHVTFQEQQSGGQGAQGGGAGAGGGGSSGGSGGQSSQQVDPSKAPSGQDAPMFARVKSNSKKGTHETNIYQKGGQAGSEKMLHQVKHDRDAQSITVTHFEEGSENKKFEMKMDGKGGKCSMTAFQGGQEMGSTTWDNSGNIGHKSKGVHSVNAQRMHINCDTHVQGGVNAAGTVTSAVGIGAPQVSGSPGSVTGISGGGKSPLE